MVLNGDILEYEGELVQPTEGEDLNGPIDLAAIELLINFMEYAWAQWYAQHGVLRINGGGASQIWKMQKMEDFSRTMNKRLTDRDTKLARKVRNRKIVKAIRRYGPMVGGAGVAGYTGLTWKDIGYRKRAERKLKQISSRQPDVDFEGFFDEGASPEEINVHNQAQHSRVEPIIVTENEMPLNIDGKGMLAWKNSLTRMYSTHMEYIMGNVLVKGLQYYNLAGVTTVTGAAVHSTTDGAGPHLYSTNLSANLVLGTNATKNLRRDHRYMEVNEYDAGYTERADWMTTTIVNMKKLRGIGHLSTCYVFCADWIGTTMNPDVETQRLAWDKDDTTVDADAKMGNKRNGYYLSFKYVSYLATTDQNIPIELSLVFENKDWTYLTHYQTKYNFKFRNVSTKNYCIEILFFKLVADVDAMNYERLVVAPMNRQNTNRQDYIDGVSPYPQDIKVMHRKRIMLPGFNRIRYPGFNQNINDDGSNVMNYKFTIKRKYIIKKPILATPGTLSEIGMFRTYYDAQKAIYCRMEAWPVSPSQMSQADSSTVASIVADTQEDANNLLETNQEGTILGYGVSCLIDKKSKFKLDEPMYKSYAKA